MNELGVGFLESIYKKALVIALKESNLNIQEEVPFNVSFRGNLVGKYFADLLVEGRVILELKCCKELLAEHQAQVINYLKASGVSSGLLINFGKSQIEYKRLYFNNF